MNFAVSIMPPKYLFESGYTLVGDTMSKSIDLACSCRKVRGKLKIVQADSFHVHCLCKDCQKFATYLGNEEKILDEHGGSELFQTYPAYMTITHGHEHIACVQLKEKGLYRWYAKCCNMPLANTMQSHKVPFIGISVKFMHFSTEHKKLESLGPVSLKSFGQYAIGEKPADVHPRYPRSYLVKMALFMLKGMFRRMYKPSPFFADKAPVVNPHFFLQQKNKRE